MLQCLYFDTHPLHPALFCPVFPLYFDLIVPLLLELRVLVLEIRI